VAGCRGSWGAAQPLPPSWWAGLPWGDWGQGTPCHGRCIKLVSGCSTTWVWRGTGEEEEAGRKSCYSLRFVVASSDLLVMPKFSTGKMVLERSSLGPHRFISPSLEELLLPRDGLVTRNNGRHLRKERNFGGLQGALTPSTTSPQLEEDV